MVGDVVGDVVGEVAGDVVRALVGDDVIKRGWLSSRRWQQTRTLVGRIENVDEKTIRDGTSTIGDMRTTKTLRTRVKKDNDERTVQNVRGEKTRAGRRDKNTATVDDKGGQRT